MSEPKQIETLPPVEELRRVVPLSPRTGEPPRPALAFIAAATSYLAAGAVAAVYALHWWQAAHPESYPASARLIEWVAPEPGKWLSLTLEGALAGAAVISAGAVAVAGFQGWNGWRWSRWAGLVALLLVGGFAVVTSDWGFIAVGLALVTATTLWLPPMTRYFRHWHEVRTTRPPPYRRPERIHYGRLPRFR